MENFGMAEIGKKNTIRLNKNQQYEETDYPY